MQSLCDQHRANRYKHPYMYTHKYVIVQGAKSVAKLSPLISCCVVRSLAGAWSTVLDGDHMMHRLGFQQQPFMVDWQQAPPASAHSRVRSILTTAAGLGCLNLRAKLQVGPSLACISSKGCREASYCVALAPTSITGT